MSSSIADSIPFAHFSDDSVYFIELLRDEVHEKVRAALFEDLLAHRNNQTSGTLYQPAKSGQRTYDGKALPPTPECWCFVGRVLALNGVANEQMYQISSGDDKVAGDPLDPLTNENLLRSLGLEPNRNHPHFPMGKFRDFSLYNAMYTMNDLQGLTFEQFAWIVANPAESIERYERSFR